MMTKTRLLLVTCLTLAFTACGPAEVTEESPAGDEMSQSEQEIGTTPLCTSGSWIEGKTVTTTCGACAVVAGGGYGLRGNYYEACCNSSGCGAWKLIKPTCGFCELQ